LVGVVVSGRSYLGVEAAKETADALWHLGMRVCEHLQVPRDRALVQHTTIQAFEPNDQADFAITSPPYWTKEVYDGARSNESFADWVETFLRPMFRKVSATLKPGCYFALNISNIRENGKLVELERVAVETAQAEGFVLVDTWRMVKRTFGRGAPPKSEPIFILRKPTE
jgi:hypothetical protein